MCSIVLNAGLMESNSIGYVFSVTECELHFSATEKGMLGASSYAGMICSSYLWGFLADKLGRRRIIQPTLFLAFLMTLISSFLRNFYLLTLFRFLNGFL